MKTYKGTQEVESGFYLHVGRRGLIDLETAQKLPGTEKDNFIAVSLVAMLLIGPFLGLLYVMFLPFISIAMVGVLLIKKAWAPVKATAKLLVESVIPHTTR